MVLNSIPRLGAHFKQVSLTTDDYDVNIYLLSLSPCWSSNKWQGDRTHILSPWGLLDKPAPRIHINQSEFFWICFTRPSHFFFSLQYISRSQYVCYSCEQGWEGDRGRGNKGLRSLAKRGWRLRQMAWSLQHSGVARLVLKSSSLTFQQILPGGWGVCHTTPRIHTALFTPISPPFSSVSPTDPASDHCVLPSLYFIPTYEYNQHI